VYLRPRKYKHNGYNYVISGSGFILSTNISRVIKSKGVRWINTAWQN